MLHAAKHALEHTFEDSLIILLVLFFTYLVMEYLEHRAGDKLAGLVQRAGWAGSIVGSVAGVIPHFSVVGSNLYAGRVITMGALIAIYLSSSDEMLPVMISARAPLATILGVLTVKVGIGIVAGLGVDEVILLRGGKKEGHVHIHEMCEHEHCDCEKGILRSALKHTVQVGIFLLLISFALNFVMELIGEKAIAGFVLNHPIFGPFAAALVGMIPNCAASVLITELYLAGVIGIGSMIAGLLAAAGVGLLVLFRVNHHKKENMEILSVLYLVSVVSGVVIELLI